MTQNTSTAVMQRRVAGTNSLDFYPTPPWATRALVEHVLWPNTPGSLKDLTVWEPAAGHGDMARPLAEYFGRVIATDIHDHGDHRVEHYQHDFLFPYWPDVLAGTNVGWIITNPPFALAEQFIARAHHVHGWEGTAMLVRSAFLEGTGRYKRLFKLNPPSIVAQYTERVVMHHGRLSPTGSTATAYCWLVWIREMRVDTRMMWIPPCRRQMEKVGDYDGRGDGAGGGGVSVGRSDRSGDRA